MADIAGIFLIIFTCLIIQNQVVCQYILGDPLKREDVKKINDRMDRCEKEMALLKESNIILRKSQRELTDAHLQMMATHRQMMNTIAELRHRLHTLENDGTFLSPADRSSSPPAKVAFTAYLDHPMKQLGQGQIIKYNRMIYNGTTAYSPLSGIFTVPVSGVYLFSWTANAKKLLGEPVYEIDNTLHVNGQKIATSFAESWSNYDDNQGSTTIVIHVNYGDLVWTSADHMAVSIHGSDRRGTVLTGVLLYSD